MSNSSKIHNKINELEITVLVCQGSKCKKKGSQEIRKDVKNFIKKNGFRKKVHVCRSMCQGFCKAAPVVAVFPAGKWLLEADSDSVIDTLEAHLSDDSEKNKS